MIQRSDTKSKCIQIDEVAYAVESLGTTQAADSAPIILDVSSWTYSFLSAATNDEVDDLELISPTRSVHEHPYPCR